MVEYGKPKVLYEGFGGSFRSRENRDDFLRSLEKELEGYEIKRAHEFKSSYGNYVNGKIERDFDDSPDLLERIVLGESEKSDEILKKIKKKSRKNKRYKKYGREFYYSEIVTEPKNQIIGQFLSNQGGTGNDVVKVTLRRSKNGKFLLIHYSVKGSSGSGNKGELTQRDYGAEIVYKLRVKKSPN